MNSLGRNRFISTGSVVTKDIPADVVAVGSPCKPVRVLAEDMIRKLDADDQYSCNNDLL